MKKSLSLILALGACMGVRAQIIATDNAEGPAYTAGLTYHGINGGTGAWDPVGWNATDWNDGQTLYVKTLNPSLLMGSQVFTTGDVPAEGADSRRRLLDPLPIGGTCSWSMMISPLVTSGEFYVDVRSGNTSNPNRDMLLLIGEPGNNWRISGNGGFSPPFTEVPMILGQRVDAVLKQTALNTYDLTLTPFGGSPQTLSGTFYSTDVQVQVLNFSSWGMNGDAYFNNIVAAVPVSNQTLSGDLELSDTSISFASNRSISYQVKQGATVLSSGTITASSKNTTLGINVPASASGSAKLVLNGSTFLQRVVTLNLTGSNQSLGSVVMANGDADDDGEVGLNDIDLIITNYGLDTASADLDVDGEVGLNDIDIAIAHYGEGDESE